MVPFLPERLLTVLLDIELKWNSSQS